MSDIRLLYPDTRDFASGTTWFVCITIVMDCSSLTSMWHLEFYSILVIQLSIEVFSHVVKRYFLLIVREESIITLFTSTSDASYRPDFFICTLGLSWDTTYLLISSSNFTLHTTGYIVVQNENHATTDPFVAMSWYNMKREVMVKYN